MRFFPLIFILTTAAFSLTGLPAFSYQIDGIVLDTDDQPVADVHIWVSRHRQVEATVSNDSGKFVIPNISSGKVALIAYKEGHALSGTEGQILRDETVTITMASPGTLSLQISNTNREPVGGARLKFLRINDLLSIHIEDFVPYGLPSIRSDDNGVMLVPFMPIRSNASVTVSHSRYAEAYLPTVPIGQPIPIVLVDGIKLRGRVSDQSGKSVEHARVTVFRSRDNREFKFSEVLTNDDGFYTAIVPPAPYYVAAHHPDYAVGDPRPVLLNAAKENPILDLTLPDAHWLSGTTVNEENEPVAHVNLEYKRDGAVYTEAVSDYEGRFRLPVNHGKGIIAVTPPAGLITVQYFEIGVDTGDEKNIELDPIQLKPLPAIKGRVSTRKDGPVSGAVIHTLNTDPPLWTTTDEEGHFELKLNQTQDEAVRLYAEHPLRFLSGDVKVDLMKPDSLDIVLKSFEPDTESRPDDSPNPVEHMVKKPAPDWACDAWFNLPEGMDEASLEILKGRVIVLTLWGGFESEGSTRDRLTELNVLSRAFSDVDDVFFLAIHDTIREPVEVEQLIRDWGIAIPVGRDADPFLSFDSYNVNVIPHTVLIDKSGKLRYVSVEGRLHELIKTLRRESR